MSNISSNSKIIKSESFKKFFDIDSDDIVDINYDYPVWVSCDEQDGTFIYCATQHIENKIKVIASWENVCK